MTDENQPQGDETQASQPPKGQLDPAFFTCVNEYLELTNRQSKQQGLKRISMASLYAAARFNAHVYLTNASGKAGEEREAFLDALTAGEGGAGRAELDAKLAANDELGALIHALDGGYVRPAPGGDILHNPQVLPTGRNTHGFDPFRIPSAFACVTGAGRT